MLEIAAGTDPCSMVAGPNSFDLSLN